MKYALRYVVLLLLTPILMGVGGDLPLPRGETYKIVGSNFLASILVDPHNDGESPSAKMASIQLFNKKGNRLLASAEFKVLPDKDFSEGCQLFTSQFSDLTAARFIFDLDSRLPLIALDSWVPQATVRFLFVPLGIINLRDPRFPLLPAGRVAPVITAIGTE